MSAVDVLALLRGQRDALDVAIRELEKPTHRTDDGYYTSLDLPPDVRTRERFAKLCRSIPGAALCGRTWRVSVTSWWEHRRARIVPPPKPPSHHGDDDVDRALAANGYRRAP